MQTYKIYIVDKQGEHGSYSADGKSRIDAIKNYSKHKEKCSFYWKHTDNWKSLGCKIGYPNDARFYQNDRNEKLLIMLG
jgi:hypothetical protein